MNIFSSNIIGFGYFQTIGRQSFLVLNNCIYMQSCTLRCPLCLAVLRALWCYTSTIRITDANVENDLFIHLIHYSLFTLNVLLHVTLVMIWTQVTLITNRQTEQTAKLSSFHSVLSTFILRIALSRTMTKQWELTYFESKSDKNNNNSNDNNL